MRICSHCQKQNADDLRYCAFCNHFIADLPVQGRFAFWQRLPLPILAVAIVAGLALFIALPIGFILAASYIEGFMSVLLVLGGFFLLRPVRAESNLLAAGALAFYALMGMALDQTGNVLFNKPIELAFCPSGSSLVRNVDVSHPLPGRTDFRQEFTCFEGTTPRKELHVGHILGMRFGEYLLLGYVFILGHRLWKGLRGSGPKMSRLSV